MKRCAASHAAHAEYINLRSFPGNIGKGFIPVDLALDAPTVALRNERLPMCETELPFAPQYVLAHRRAPDGVLRKLFPDAVVDPLRCMPLLPRGLHIRFQYQIDERLDRVQPRSRTWCIRSLRRQSRLDGLPDEPPVNTQLLRYRPDRSASKLILSPDLFE